MTSVIISVLLLAGVPLLLLILLKASAGIMFLAACAGVVLLDSLDPAVVTTASAIVPVQDADSYIRLAVVLLSVVFAAMMFKNTVSTGHMLYSIFVVLTLGSMLWLLLPESSGVSWLLESTQQSVWQDTNSFKTLIIASGFSLSLIDILFVRRYAKHAKKHKKEH